MTKAIIDKNKSKVNLKKLNERKYEQKKKMTLGMFKLFKRANVSHRLFSNNRLQQLHDCGHYLMFVQDDTGKRKLVRASFCRIRLCPMCQWRKSLKLYGQVNRMITEQLKAVPSLRYLFITFTVPNVVITDLPNMLDMLDKAFKRVVDKTKGVKKLLAGQCIERLRKQTVGYMRAIEVTYNSKTNMYHPHIHCIFAVKSSYFTHGYIKKCEWQQIWGNVMGTDELIVHVRTVGDRARGVAEAAKYPVKSAELLRVNNPYKATQALAYLQRALRGRRLVTFGGDFAKLRKQLHMRSVEDSKTNIADIASEQLSGKPIMTILARWNMRVGAYVY